jgi:L-aspartate oxidase
VQFHPTALYLKNAPRFLLSEALRGEGAYLRNIELKRFMPKYHELAELAPRDVVARAIAHEIEVQHRPDATVYLDLTHLNPDRVRSRFPTIYATCMRYNIDIATELIPVRPAAHYSMGGVRTDLDGRTSIDRLYAAGEVACTGVHGANRLASNSLLEGLVYGARAATAMRDEAITTHLSIPIPTMPQSSNGNNAEVEALIRQVQSLMWQHAGVVREGNSLRQVVGELSRLQQEAPKPGSRLAREAANILDTGLLIARAALAREESRGAHYRTDFPLKNDVKFHKHSVIRDDAIRFE